VLPGLALGALAVAGLRAADRADLDRRIARAGAHATSPDVILILADTLRADALGAYGADPSPTPFLDDLAARSVLFEHAVAQAPWTAPSVSSLLSSLYPSTFLWNSRDMITEQRLVQLPAGLPWLPAVLAGAGYHTAAFVKNPLMQGGTNFGQGFHVHEWVRGDTAERHSAGQLVDAVLRWGDALADHRAAGGDGAWFAYVHFMDPHARYEPPRRWRPRSSYDGPVDGGVSSLEALEDSVAGPTPEDVAHARALYRAEVAYLDAELARLHAGLAERGLWTDDTVVLVVSDHGEQFYEHRRFFHRHLNWENVHVPLLFRAPELAPRRVAHPVALLDVAPTLLDWLGLDVPVVMEGRSLVAQLRGAPVPRRFVVSERVGRGTVRTTGPDGSFVVGDGRSWFEDPSGTTYSLDAVPPEARDRLAELRRAHAAWRERPRPAIEGLAGEHRELDPDADTARRLRALGYLE
jgi:arylsulfatase A-like enzyme